MLRGECCKTFCVSIVFESSIHYFIAGYSPMHLSVLNGKVEETKCLISRGAEVNLKVREKWRVRNLYLDVTR